MRLTPGSSCSSVLVIGRGGGRLHSTADRGRVQRFLIRGVFAAPEAALTNAARHAMVARLMRQARSPRPEAPPRALARALRGALAASLAALPLWLAAGGAAAPRPAPGCVPAALDAPARIDGVTVSPMPGA